jgi:hypothetical protein
VAARAQFVRFAACKCKFLSRLSFSPFHFVYISSRSPDPDHLLNAPTRSLYFIYIFSFSRSSSVRVLCAFSGLTFQIQSPLHLPRIVKRVSPFFSLRPFSLFRVLSLVSFLFSFSHLPPRRRFTDGLFRFSYHSKKFQASNQLIF